MSEESELPVPEESYTNIRKVIHNPQENLLVVKTDGMGAVENQNEQLLPEDEDGVFDGVSTGYVGGIEKLEVSAFSEDISEVLAFADELKTNNQGNMSISFDSCSNVLPALRFRENHDKVKAVVTNRERL
jgi:hypothetical protein